MHIKKLSAILLIIGILVGVSPIVGQLYTKFQEYRMMAEWQGSEDAAAIEETVEADPEEGYYQLQEAFAPEGNTVEVAAEGTSAPTIDQTEAAMPDQQGIITPDQTGTTTSDQSDATTPDQPGATTPNQPVTTEQDHSEAAAEPAKQASKQTVLGIIQIGKIKVKAPIVEGVRSSNLKAGVGHIPGTAAPGKPGNSALAGHRSYTFGKFFNRLDELVIGDEVIITTKKKDLKYKVYQILVVTPDDVSVLKGSKDDNTITLITCTPIYVASHRLIVHARLVDETLKK